MAKAEANVKERVSKIEPGELQERIDSGESPTTSKVVRPG